MDTEVSVHVPVADTESYDWRAVEQRWQASWRDHNIFVTPALSVQERGHYIFTACPFTSGSAHIGHIRSYTIADAYARFCRASGKPVLFTLGFDAFGLPTELEAIRRQTQPQEWVTQCRTAMRRQFETMGYSFDWTRSHTTCEPDIYRWSQWLFLTFLSNGLIYRSHATLDWCDSCKTVLARAEVEDGACWRCGTDVALVSRPQWFLRSRLYAAENERRLANVERWTNSAVGAQRAILGRIDGVEVQATALDGKVIDVFTPYGDAISQARFVAVATNYPDLEQWITDDSVIAATRGLRSGGWTRSDRSAGAMPIVETGIQVHVPTVEHLLPLIISPYVDARFGPTVALGVPERDAADAAIASQITVVAPSMPWRISGRASAPKAAVRYSAQDYPVSRQRAWGSPLPLIHCAECGIVPVPMDSLPVKLPADLTITKPGGGLVGRRDFIECHCPKCDGPAERDVETLDCHFDSLWVWIAACVPQASRDRQMFDYPDLAKWLPVSQVVWGVDGGAEVASLRTATKMLRDLSILDCMQDGEPFRGLMMHDMVRRDGRKMSKHLGNVVDPENLITRFGADVVRFAILHAAAPRNGIEWREHELEYCSRFLSRVWTYAMPRMREGGGSYNPSDICRADRLRRALVGWCATATRKITNDLASLEMHRATRNVILLLARIEDFETRVIDARGGLDEPDRQALVAGLHNFTQLLAPIAPHLAEELWAAGHNAPYVSTARWPAAVNAARDTGQKDNLSASDSSARS